ncbi:MAG: T9SS type A sorting domain-containing protein [bacterium]
MMKIIGLLAIINILICPLLLSRSNEFLLDTNLTYMPAPSGQSHPAIAFDGTNYFVVWYDWSRGISYHYDMSMYYNIYGCRVDPEGIVLDSAGIHISYYVLIAGYLPRSPGIAYGNGIFLITWSDFRKGLGGDIYGARIDTNGVVLDPAGLEISVIPVALQATPAVAFDGTNFFVAWYDQRVPAGIYGCRVRPDGTILDPEGILISTSEEGVFISISFDNTDYLVVWGNTDISGARVDTAGTILDTSAIVICAASDNQLDPAVTFGSENYFIVWEDWRSGSNNADIYGARVDTAGILLDSNSIAISTLPDYEYHPSTVFDGTNYLVAWTDYATTYCVRVDTSGIILDTCPVVVSQDTAYDDHSTSVAFDGTNYFITWHTGQFSDDEIYGARVETSGVVIDTASILLSMAAYAGRSSSASFDGINYFAVWEDDRDSSSSYVYGTRVDTFGTVLDPDGVPIIDGANPVVAFDGTNYLTVCSGVKAVRVDTAGTVIDTIDVFADGGDNPSIIFDSTRYFVAWEYNNDICAVRIDTTGSVLDTTAIVISNGVYYDRHPSIGFDGTNYFVVWYYGTHESTFDIYGVRIDTTGVLLDTISIPIATGSYRQWYPSIAFDGLNYLAVWEDRRNGYAYADIYGARVTQDGVVLDTMGMPLCTAASAQYSPEIKFDGQNYCVIWEDWRNGDYTDIYGCYVNPSGTVIEEFLVSDQPNLQLEPALTKGSDKFLITYTGFNDTLSARPANTMRIWGKFQNFTGIEENETQMQNLDFILFQNYPNPFTQTTKIRYHLTHNSKANLKIYDVTGCEVRSFPIVSLCNQDKFVVSVCWDGKDNAGYNVGAGVYFYRFDTGKFNQVRKMILLK